MGQVLWTPHLPNALSMLGSAGGSTRASVGLKGESWWTRHLGIKSLLCCPWLCGLGKVT